jgi:hypothetical protein
MLALASLSNSESLGGWSPASPLQAGADQRIAEATAPVRRNARRFTPSSKQHFKPFAN